MESVSDREGKEAKEGQGRAGKEGEEGEAGEQEKEERYWLERESRLPAISAFWKDLFFKNYFIKAF